MPLLPSVAIPVGHTAEGLPVGMQLIGPKWSDHRILSIGEELSSVLGRHFTTAATRHGVNPGASTPAQSVCVRHGPTAHASG